MLQITQADILARNTTFMYNSIDLDTLLEKINNHLKLSASAGAYQCQIIVDSNLHQVIVHTLRGAGYTVDYYATHDEKSYFIDISWLNQNRMEVSI